MQLAFHVLSLYQKMKEVILVIKEIYSVPSHDGMHQLHTICWRGEGDVIAVLQIVHGMAEFIERYDSFANYLVKRNIAVIGHDQLGHGQTATETNELGYFADKDGANIVISDMYRITKKAKELFPNIPVFLMGHSMGSYFARKYITLFGDKIQGALLVGTGDIPAKTVLSAKLLASCLMKVKGPLHRSEFLHQTAFRSYLKRIPDHSTEKDWLTRDRKIVSDYLANGLNMFVFTVSGFHDMFSNIAYCSKKTRFHQIPRTLPILFASGAEDPVGEWGKAPAVLYHMYSQEGFTDIDLFLYEDCRHEIINELNKYDIFDDLGNWIIKKCTRN